MIDSNKDRAPFPLIGVPVQVVTQDRSEPDRRGQGEDPALASGM